MPYGEFLVPRFVYHGGIAQDAWKPNLIGNMNNTVRIFRNLLALRSCRSVFSLKYCTSREDGTESVVKPEVDNKSDKDAFVQEKQTLERDPGVGTRTETKNIVNSFSSNIKTSDNVGNLSHDSFEKSDSSSNEQSSSSSSDSDESDDDDGVEAKQSNQTFKEFISKVESGAIMKPEEPETFASLLRKSAFIELGDPVDKYVVGKINMIVDNSAYVDFGWKFLAVCQLPNQHENESYRPGSKVVLQIKDLELCTKFLGDVEFTSLLEADCKLISPYE